MLARGPGLLTWAVCRYCNIKYQSWAGVSSKRNWKPAEVMQGGSPGSVLDTNRDNNRDMHRKATISTCPLMLLLSISGCTLLNQLPPILTHAGHPVYQRPKEMAKQGAAVPQASSPLHEPSLAEELSQILADSCTGRAHHEV